MLKQIKSDMKFTNKISSNKKQQMKNSFFLNCFHFPFLVAFLLKKIVEQKFLKNVLLKLDFGVWKIVYLVTHLELVQFPPGVSVWIWNKSVCRFNAKSRCHLGSCALLGVTRLHCIVRVDLLNFVCIFWHARTSVGAPPTSKGL